ncbi:MAG: rod shape-determining protein RodA [Planctomycetes bacterium]|nr:rod shape-determining protein RodA [Planctomycetota bacterium]
MKRPVTDLTRPGTIILAAVGVLALLGVVSIYGAESVRAGRPMFTIKQMLFLGVSAGAGVGILKIGYRRIARYAYPIALLAVALLVPLTVAKMLGIELGGLLSPRRNVYRWITLPGFHLQPSEFMKLAYILALAHYLRFRKNYRQFSGLLLPFGLTMIPLGLILTEPDLGTALLMMPVLFVMLFLAGAHLKHLALIALVGVVCVPIVAKPYQIARITTLLMQSESFREQVAEDPERYAFLGLDQQSVANWRQGNGWQLIHSKAALGSGGVLGQGWGEGTYVDYEFLPDRHNDFVFSLVGHQFGLLGCLVILGCFAAIIMAGATIATATTEPEGRLLAVGVIALLAAQVTINIGMTVGLMPITGMTLPFVSYGGSSLLANAMAIALLISVSQDRPFLLSPKPFEFPAER